MNLNNDKIKLKVLLYLNIFFTILTFIAIFCLNNQIVTNAGCAIIPMICSLISSALYKDCQKEINSNKNQKGENE